MISKVINYKFFHPHANVLSFLAATKITII
jgi:hypothetical protein